MEALLAEFDLGGWGRLSGGPVASGRLGSIWRLDTDTGSWAVKEAHRVAADERAEVLDGAAFQEAARAAGVPVPPIRRAIDGALFAPIGDTEVRVQAWVDLEPPNLCLAPAAVGDLVGRLHRVPYEGTIGTDAWYEAPLGELAWRVTIASLHRRGAPFADELEAHLPEMLALEALLGEPPRALRTCHRDLWADNVRGTPDGGLCVFDFDNAGLQDPSRELATVLVEHAGWDAARARAIRDAYGDAGGPGRVEAARDFSMVIAQLFHIVAEGCRRWLAAADDEQRADNEGWVREYLDRPLSRGLVEALLDA